MMLPKSTREQFELDKFVTDQYPDVEGTFCISVKVPADLQYVYALQGLVAQMTKYWNYTGTGDDRKVPAALAQAAYDATDWEGCMDCDGVTDCIENNETTRQAVREAAASNSNFPPDYPLGENLPPERLSQDLSSAYNPTCNLAVLFAQVTGAVDLTNDFITDVLEKWEQFTNSVELIKNITSTIPLIGGIKTVAGIDGAFDMINYYQESFNEGYLAQYTVTPFGIRDQIRCALFCVCMDDCVITIDRIVEVMTDRLAVYFTPPTLSGFVDLVTALAGIDIETTFVVDLAFFAAWGFVKTANYLFGGQAGGVLDLVIRLQADEPDNDYLELCDCARDWIHQLASTDFTNPAYFPSPGWGSVTGTTFTQTNPSGVGDATGLYIEIEFAVATEIVGYQINQVSGSGIEGSGVVNRFISFLNASGGTIQADNLPIQDGTWNSTQEAAAPGCKKIVIQYIFANAALEFEWDKIEFYGKGSDPF